MRTTASCISRRCRSSAPGSCIRAPAYLDVMGDYPGTPVGGEFVHLALSRHLRDALYLALARMVGEGEMSESEAVRAGRGVLRAEAGRPLPDYVETEFDAYLKCGRLEERFLRQRCEQWPFLRCTAHGRDCRAAGRRDPARAPAAPVGAVTADGAALPSGDPLRRALRRARRGVSHDLGPSAGRGSPDAPRRRCSMRCRCRGCT